jgi:hypothetical protein
VDGRDRFLTEGAAGGEDFDGALSAHWCMGVGGRLQERTALL